MSGNDSSVGKLLCEVEGVNKVKCSSSDSSESSNISLRVLSFFLPMVNSEVSGTTSASVISWVIAFVSLPPSPAPPPTS